jgi:mutator protein MutT
MQNYVKTIRKAIGAEKIFVPGVRGIIVNHNQEILLQLRTDTSSWGLPAGSVELNETARQALSREVKEETNLEIISAEPMSLSCGPSQQFTYPNGDCIQCFALTFVVKEWRGQPTPDMDEGSELRFFALSDLPENLIPTHKETLKDYARYDGNFIVR